jgi:hypothetical protein
LPQLLNESGRALIADPGRRYVDAFVALVEAGGCRCELLALRRVPHAEVLILEVRRCTAAC